MTAAALIDAHRRLLIGALAFHFEAAEKQHSCRGDADRLKMALTRALHRGNAPFMIFNAATAHTENARAPSNDMTHKPLRAFDEPHP